MNIMVQSPWWDKNEYELLDSGDGRKIERFGENILIRPEPQALWKPSNKLEEWDELADANFERMRSGKGSSTGDTDKGSWELKRGVKEQWWIRRAMPQGGTMSLRMGMTSFKHVGVFAEQASNWDFLQSRVTELASEGEEVRALNMFAYTGAASISMAMAGAKVTHLDSVKAVNIWAKENAEASGINNIRFITDDAMEFAARELRRGSKYRLIVLDPPAYGRGTDGQKWVLEENIYEMMGRVRDMLEMRAGSTVLLSLYSMGFSALLAHTLVSQVLGKGFKIEVGELFLEDNYDKKLPLGIFLRAIYTA